LAQNLVPNPSFEQHTNCTNPLLANAIGWCLVPNGGGQIGYYNACQSMLSARTPHQYLSTCFQSYQPVRTGVAYTEIASYVQSIGQESAISQVKLTDTLKAGKTYCVTYYTSLWNYCNFSIDKLGALLTPTPFPCFAAGGPTVAIAGLYSPQVVTTPGVAFEDTLNWMEVSGVFTALGNEAYLALGDFFLHSQHFIKNSYPANCNGLADYYVDDVSVEEVQLAKCKNDTSICPTDSVLLGNNVSEATAYSWLPTNGLSCSNCANPKASPNVTTTYTLTKTQCKAVTTASITVTVKTDCTPKVILSEIPNVFTPNSDGINDTFNFSIVGASDVSFNIYNRWGNIIHQTTNNQSQTTMLWDGRTTSGEACNEGVYFFTLQYTDAKGNTQRKNGYVSLFR
jgi:gliding motility-associated-like protein